MAAAICTVLKPPRVPVASASPLPTMHALPLLRRRPRSLTTACAAVLTQQQGQGAAVPRRRSSVWTAAPVSAIAPATDDRSMWLITLDLSGAPDLVAAYTTPGQYLLTRVLNSSLAPVYMCISSAPHSGLHFDLLVKSVPGTTSEQLCKLHVGQITEPGFAIQNINPPEAAETVLLFAVAEGISPIRALIEYGFSAHERADVRLFYAAKDMKSMPYQERFKKWEETGVKVVPLALTQKNQQPFLEHNLDGIIVDPLSTGAVIVGPLPMKEGITGFLSDFGVPQDKILSIAWYPDVDLRTLAAFGLNGLGLIQ